ncbi:protein YIPF6 isoform X1 [Candoia aspera]|uniref:protein YIPF6 isoform X1 n=1 Tax=Candoia aspera TaxID=51853 RepID=UPI002FD82F64
MAAAAAAAGSGATKPLFAGLADVSISEDIPVEGEITVPVGPNSPDEDYSTLDEPVKETVMRDLKAVGKKFVHVMYPKKSSTLLRDWDLWGPLILCVLLALMLQGGAADSTEDRGPQFAEVFVIIWFGAVVITLNSKLLGGTIIYSLLGRQPTPKPQSSCCLSHFPFLFCYQLDDPHLYAIVNMLSAKTSKLDEDVLGCLSVKASLVDLPPICLFLPVFMMNVVKRLAGSLAKTTKGLKLFLLCFFEEHYECLPAEFCFLLILL